MKRKPSHLASYSSWINIRTIFKFGVLPLITALILYFMFVYIDHRSYLWQSIELPQYLRTVHRVRCDFDSNNSSTLKSPPPRIALIMLYDDKDGSWAKSLMDAVLSNRRQYAEKHGYAVIVANEVLDPSRPPAWSKLLAVEKYLPQYDYLFYVDMDVVIMDMSTPLTAFLPSSQTSDNSNSNRETRAWTRTSESRDRDRGGNVDIVMTGDWNGPNTGVWLVRHSAWSLWFLRTAWSEGQAFVLKWAPDGTPFPFEYEQRAFHYLLGSTVWAKRRLPVYDEAVRRRQTLALQQQQLQQQQQQQHLSATTHTATETDTNKDTSTLTSTSASSCTSPERKVPRNRI